MLYLQSCGHCMLLVFLQFLLLLLLPGSGSSLQSDLQKLQEKFIRRDEDQTVYGEWILQIKSCTNETDSWSLYQYLMDSLSEHGSSTGFSNPIEIKCLLSHSNLKVILLKYVTRTLLEQILSEQHEHILSIQPASMLELPSMRTQHWVSLSGTENSKRILNSPTREGPPIIEQDISDLNGGDPEGLLGWHLDVIDQQDPRSRDGLYRYQYDGQSTAVWVVDSGIQVNHAHFEGRAQAPYVQT